jgi:hypothetical protein
MGCRPSSVAIVAFSNGKLHRVNLRRRRLQNCSNSLIFNGKATYSLRRRVRQALTQTTHSDG